MEKVIIEPSIATLIEVKAIGKSERRPVIFTAAEAWPGLYTLRVWNSDQKTNEYTMPVGSLDVVAAVMTWWIDATAQSLPAGKKYAEIYSNDFLSIIFKCEFEILK